MSGTPIEMVVVLNINRVVSSMMSSNKYKNTNPTLIAGSWIQKPGRKHSVYYNINRSKV